MPESDTGLIYIYWAVCRECGYTTAVHGRARCPDCADETLTPKDIAGAVVDDKVRSATADTDDE